jgi:Right handed beta helix region
LVLATRQRCLPICYFNQKETTVSRTHTIAFLLATVAALATTPAHAVQRTFVASFGADTNTAANCSLATPCRGFAAAQTVTDNNGEIIVLDSAGYGAVAITKSISITAPAGVYAGIAVFPGSNGVNIATAGINVVLRGLTINGQGGSTGINMTAGNSLTVENCVISNVGGDGINVDGVIKVNITDSIIRRNGFRGINLQNGVTATITLAVVSGNAGTGINVLGSLANTTAADIADSTIDGNDNGVTAASFNATAVIKVSVHDSRVVRNSVFGLGAQTGAGAAISLSASNNIVSNNGGGIAAINAGAKVWASGNTVSDNSTVGLFNSSALFETAGNNAVRNNGANSGTITVIATQ